jgi:hypothetical protein
LGQEKKNVGRIQEAKTKFLRKALKKNFTKLKIIMRDEN